MWTDEWPVEWTNWDNVDGSNDTCATMTLEDGKWRPASCDTELKYVCKHNSSPKPTSPPPGACPEGWEDIGTSYCYMFLDTQVGF